MACPRNNECLNKSNLILRVQSQNGIGSNLILHCREGESSQIILHTAADKIRSIISFQKLYVTDENHSVAKHYYLKFDDKVIVKGTFHSNDDAKRNLSDLALVELQKVCFTIVKKTYPRDLPKVNIPSTYIERQESSTMGGIGEEIECSSNGSDIQEQICTNIVSPSFHVNHLGFASHNVMQEVMEVLEKYSASQDFNSFAFNANFTKDERTVIHLIAKSLNLHTRSYGKNKERFLIVEKKIDPWDLIHLLLEAGNENEQYKLIIPTNFLL